MPKGVQGFQKGHKINVGKKLALGYKHTEEWKRKMSKMMKGKNKWMLGKKHSEETKKKMSLSHLEEKSSSWKGDEVSYYGLHIWVTKHLGRPKLCEHCGTTEARKFEWANKDHTYKRNLTDWIRLCTSCHRKYDYRMTKSL